MKHPIFLTTLLASLLSASCSNKGNNGNNPGPNTDDDEPTILEVMCVDFGLDNGDAFSKYTIHDLVISADKGEGQVNPAYYNKGEVLRLYKGNTLSFKAGGEIKEIEFTYYETPEKMMTPDSGEYSEGKWTGNIKELTFTIENNGSGYNAIKGLKVTYLSTYSGKDDEYSVTTFTFQNIADGQFTSTSKGDVTISATKGTGQAAPAGNSNYGELRTYKGNMLTIEGKTISKIQFTVSKEKDGEFSAREGELVGLVWTGESNSVTFDILDGQRRFTKIVVYHQGESGEDSRTIEQVAQDVCDAVFYGETNYNQGIDWEDGEAIIERMSDETTLVGATTDGVNRVSRVSYLVYVDEYGVQEDEWENNVPGAFAYFYDKDYATNGIMVEIGSYEEYGSIFVQYCVYIDDEE